jgi:hypothetical protein
MKVKLTTQVLHKAPKLQVACLGCSWRGKRTARYVGKPCPSCYGVVIVSIEEECHGERQDQDRQAEVTDGRRG